MASQKNLNSIFTDVATAIRGKTGSSDPIYPVDFADEISAIETGSDPVLVTATFTQNGVYNASSYSADGFKTVNVNVSSSEKPTLASPSLNYGTVSRPLTSNTNPSNGGFVNQMIYRVGDKYSYENIQITSAVESVPWIYDITPLEGGTFTIYASEVGTGFNNSPETSKSVTMLPATQTTGYISVANAGDSTPSNLTYTYDENFPRSFREVTDTYGNHFIRIPTIYRKVLASSDGQITSFALATSKLDNDYEPYPCFVDETNNNAILPFVLVGKYCVSSTSTANSVNASYASLNIGAGRTLCRNRGTGYQQFDWKFQKLFTDLGWLISRYVNINQGANIYVIMGIAHQQNYIWVDGISHGSTEDPTAWYVCNNEANYQNAGGGTSTSTSVAEATILNNGYTKLSYVSPSASKFIAKLGYDTSNPFLNYPADSPSSASQSTYYCDYFYTASGARPVRCIVGNSLSYHFGWFCCDANYDWSSTFAVRLCYRPVAGATGYVETTRLTTLSGETITDSNGATIVY